MNKEIIEALTQQRTALTKRGENNSAADREAIYHLDRAIELCRGADAKRALQTPAPAPAKK